MKVYDALSGSEMDFDVPWDYRLKFTTSNRLIWDDVVEQVKLIIKCKVEL